MLTLSSGAFVAAPVGGLLFAIAACLLRLSAHWIYAKSKGQRFDAFDRPVLPPPAVLYTGRGEAYGDTNGDEQVEEEVIRPTTSGKFF